MLLNETGVLIGWFKMVSNEILSIDPNQDLGNHVRFI